MCMSRVTLFWLIVGFDLRRISLPSHTCFVFYFLVQTIFMPTCQHL